MGKAKTVLVAALAQVLTLGGAEGARTAPTEFRILPSGAFSAVDGRPGTDLEDGGTVDGQWHLDAALAQALIARAAAERTDMLIDYEHQSLLKADNGKPAPASGWFKRSALAWRDDGLWATGVSWTTSARAAIEADEYRYLSPVFAYDDQGRVLALISVALTNTPALDTLGPLISQAALSRIFGDSSEDELDKDQQIAALTKERDTAATSVAALTTENGQLKANVAALTAERDQLKQARETAQAEQDKAKHAELLQAALTDGRLAPAQKPWAEKQSLAALTEFLDAAKPVVDLTKRQAEGGGDGGGQSLSQEELAMCTRMGVSAEDFLKAKKA